MDNNLLSQSIYPKPTEPPFSKWKFPIIILFVILVGIAIWYFWPKNVNQLPNLSQETATTTLPEIKDWKIYRNEEYGFEIKYPYNLPVFEVRQISEPEQQKKGVYLINGVDFVFDLSDAGWPGDSTMFGITAWPVEYWNTYKIIDDSGIIHDKKRPDIPGPKFIAKNDRFVFTYFQAQECPEKYCSTFNQISEIFSTFKFVEQKVIDWNTQNEGDFTGYYIKIEKVYGEENTGPYTCDSFIVVKGDETIVNYFKNIWQNGNTVNNFDSGGNFEINLDLSKISLADKNRPLAHLLISF